jgi:hypothetical protein
MLWPGYVPSCQLGPWLAGPVCVCGGPCCWGDGADQAGAARDQVLCWPVGRLWRVGRRPGRGLSLPGQCLRGRPAAVRRARQKMFERFTDRARRVVVLAQEEARMLNHNYIGTEHILLGLIHEGEGVAAKALESLGVSLEGCARRLRRSSARASRRRRGISRSPLVPRRSLSCRCVSPGSLATTTSGPSTSCWACCVRVRAWRPRCW